MAKYLKFTKFLTKAYIIYKITYIKWKKSDAPFTHCVSDFDEQTTRPSIFHDIAEFIHYYFTTYSHLSRQREWNFFLEFLKGKWFWIFCGIAVSFPID